MTRHQHECEAVDSQGKLVRVPLRRGDWKLLPNNPGNPETGEIYHEHCPPEQVASEMDQLVRFHLAHEDVPPEVEAAWLHHRFTQIHPFQDGNGRVARALATLVFLRAGAFPLVVTLLLQNDNHRDHGGHGVRLVSPRSLCSLWFPFAASPDRTFCAIQRQLAQQRLRFCRLAVQVQHARRCTEILQLAG